MAGYIGNAPINNSIYKQIFTPSTGVTTFTTGTAYTPGFIDVYQNGIKLIDTTDYTASNGTTVDLIVAATTGDTVEIIVYETFQSAAPSAYTGNFSVGGTLSVSGTGTVSGAFRHGVLAKTADYTVLDTDADIIRVTPAAQTDITMPDVANNVGRTVWIVNVDGAYKVKAVAAGSDVFRHESTWTRLAIPQIGAVRLTSDGVSWIPDEGQWYPQTTSHTAGITCMAGGLRMINASSRNAAWDTSTGLTATTMTNCWARGDIESRIPTGVRALFLKVYVSTGSSGARVLKLRKNGVSTDDNQQSTSVWKDNEGSVQSATTSYVTCLCDTNGIIE